MFSCSYRELTSSSRTRIITVGLGAIAFFILTDRPAVAGWLTEEEKGECSSKRSGSPTLLTQLFSTPSISSYASPALAEHRIRSENTSAAAVEGFNRRGVLQGILHPSTLVLTLVFLLNKLAYSHPESLPTL